MACAIHPYLKRVGAPTLLWVVAEHAADRFDGLHRQPLVATDRGEGATFDFSQADALRAMILNGIAPQHRKDDRDAKRVQVILKRTVAAPARIRSAHDLRDH
jgi:hypothetical protein